MMRAKRKIVGKLRVMVYIVLWLKQVVLQHVEKEQIIKSVNVIDI